MVVSTSAFGHLPDGREVKLFKFKSSKGMVVGITNYGATITSIKVPDSKGKVEEVNVGFPSLEGYLTDHPYFGATVGRYANRIANGRFELEGKEYSLAKNNGPNHLHGGVEGFHRKLWDYQVEKHDDYITLSLTYQSPHMEEGYPGNLIVKVDYIVHDGNEIQIQFSAKTDRVTHVNLTNHCYFNLSGFKESIANHKLWLDGYAYLPIDESQIPTGEIKRWENTPFDFSSPTLLGPRIDLIPEGIDHCFALKLPRSLTVHAANLQHESSGRFLKVYCTQPGIQVYTSNFLDGTLAGHDGVKYKQHDAVCLETQHFPDSPNKSNFPMTLLAPEEDYEHEVRLVFGVLKR